MVLINTLKVEQLKQLLSSRNLSSVGTKAELVQRLTEAIGEEEIEIESKEEQLQTQIDELKDMMKNVFDLVKANVTNSRTAEIASLEINSTREERPLNITPSLGVTSGQCRTYSVREIAETLPDFDPTGEDALPVSQFINRVNSAKCAYEWDDKCLLLAVYSKMRGVAKMWLDGRPEMFYTWSELAHALKAEFEQRFDEADVHFKMKATMRKPGESVTDYCFRINAIGQGFELSESAIIKYARDGLKNREMQNAVAAMRFNSMKELRETLNEYSRNVTKPTEVIKSTAPKYGVGKGDLVNDIKVNNTAKGLIHCYNCNENGHISSKCPKPQTHPRCLDCDKVHKKNEPVNCGKSVNV